MSIPGTRTHWLVGLAIVAVILGFVGLTVLPDYVVEDAQRLVTEANAPEIKPVERLALHKDVLLFRADVQIKIWLGVLQALTGIGLLAGLFMTWKNLLATQDKLDIDREGQLTNRFNTATSQLGAQLNAGAPNVEARLGGIYALEWMSKDSDRLFWPIMEIMASYVRHNAPIAPIPTAARPRADVQAVLIALGRSDAYKRKDWRDAHKLDLRFTDLRDAEFYDAHLEGIDFWNANLAGAKFWGAVLQTAKLSYADLSGANLRAVQLAGAEMVETNFAGADFTGASIVNADLSRAKGLTQAQIDSTEKTWRTGAKLPGGLTL